MPDMQMVFFIIENKQLNVTPHLYCWPVLRDGHVGLRCSQAHDLAATYESNIQFLLVGRLEKRSAFRQKKYKSTAQDI